MSRIQRLRRRYLRLRVLERRRLKTYRLTRKETRAARKHYIKAKSLGPSLGARALDAAQDLIGVMEQGGNNRGPMVEKIILANGGLIGEPWCGDFVAYCYRKAGSKAVSRPWAAVRALRGLAGLQVVTNPKPGDLVVFTFDHVGLFEKRVNGTTIRTIEGNTGATGAVSDSKTGGDGVYRKNRATNQVAHYLRVTK